VALKLGDTTHPAQNVRRFERKDVAKRFGVRDPEAGFYATFDLPGVNALTELKDMVVLGGSADRTADAVLRQSDSLMMSIQAGEEA
jgi:hypothetical protein